MNTKKPKKTKNVSVHYAEHETGWVEPLGDGTFRVCNIPMMMSNLNIDDIVTLKPGNPACCSRSVIDQVLREVYAHRVAVKYPGDPPTVAKAAYKALWHAVDGIEGKCEGWTLGWAGVAVHDVEKLENALSQLPFETSIQTGVEGEA